MWINAMCSRGREAAEYLLNLGHVRIACLSGDRFLLYNNDRKMGYMLALAERGIPFDGQLCVEVPSVPEEQDQALEALFAREDRPTAVLVSDDILAVALEKACIGLGLSIPGDVSILSFNNSLLARLTFPPLTSVDVNACQLGIEAAAQMISHVENPELVATKIIVPHTWWSGRAAREPEGSAVIEIREQYNTSQAGDCLGAFLLSDISPGSAGISANCLIF